MSWRGRTRSEPMTITTIEPDWPAPAGVIALSTTRRGGCSRPPFDSFNLALHVGDDAAAVASNRAMLLEQLPPGTAVQWLTQVHGRMVVEAGRSDACPEADACWSAEPGVACAVLTADCLPVLFCDRAGRKVAAAHAGWRGLLAGVVEAAVAAMAVDPGQLMAWLGPAIGPAAFEVGGEVREAYLAETRSGAEFAQVESFFLPRRGSGGRYSADLCALARLRLQQAGVTAIFGGDECTYADPDRFYSFRRDGATGRMASLVMLRTA